ACGRLFYTPSSRPHTLTSTQNSPQTHRRPGTQSKRHHDALRRRKNKISTTASAQCFPRLARPLHGAILMQLHEHTENAPALTTLISNRG
ncbi:hypothetical protein, partial [Escherichia coli]|uniref:hypothetical protein n=1 Tax=Escherichia coli TaxID=562 RepID=UPI001BC89B62